MRNAVNFIAYQVGWFAIVLTAARGRVWVAPLVAASLFALHLALTDHRRGEAWFVPLAALLGFGVDSLQAAARVFAFTPDLLAPWPCPLWILSLWVGFATLLNGSLRWLQRRLALAALLGLAGGPLAYLGGERLGALQFPVNRWLSLASVAIAWAMLTPALLLLARRSRGGAAPVPAAE